MSRVGKVPATPSLPRHRPILPFDIAPGLDLKAAHVDRVLAEFRDVDRSHEVSTHYRVMHVEETLGAPCLVTREDGFSGLYPLSELGSL
jgi:hypothetical protein